LSKRKILIVDDDLDMRRGLNARLQANGYETAFAGDAVLAITTARHERPDLILLDIGLPGGDGYVVMQRLQRIASLDCVPIIVVSAREPSTHEPKSTAAGAIGYFQKPVDIDGLLSAIANALGNVPPA
jgi:DNA-binding response OmpR family regulator